jgi:DNA primase
MQKRFSARELFEIRNNIPIITLIKDELQIPSKIRDGVFRFLCPVCGEFQTATQSTTNLARCFRCERNFNTIDLMMQVKKSEFVESVLNLQHLLRKIPNRNKNIKQQLNKLVSSIGQDISGRLK